MISWYISCSISDGLIWREGDLWSLTQFPFFHFSVQQSLLRWKLLWLIYEQCSALGFRVFRMPSLTVFNWFFAICPILLAVGRVPTCISFCIIFFQEKRGLRDLLIHEKSFPAAHHGYSEHVDKREEICILRLGSTRPSKHWNQRLSIYYFARVDHLNNFFSDKPRLHRSQASWLALDHSMKLISPAFSTNYFSLLVLQSFAYQRSSCE